MDICLPVLTESSKSRFDSNSVLNISHIIFGIVACTLSDNLSRNSCIFLPFVYTIFTFQISFFCNGLKGFCFHILSTFTFSFVISSFYYSITVYAILHFKL